MNVFIKAKTIKQLLAWRKIAKYVNTNKTPEQKRASSGGTCNLERDIIHVVEELFRFHTDLSKYINIGSIEFVVSGDSLRPDIWIKERDPFAHTHLFPPHLIFQSERDFSIGHLCQRPGRILQVSMEDGVAEC
tara:strand:+ start:118 stop:516 length:399 start_codon:yes stop_codon:yes gene_type:complete